MQNIKSDTLVDPNNDILLRLSLTTQKLSWANYDGTMSMFIKKSGVTKILTLQPMARAIHCFGRSQSLPFDDFQIITETMLTAGAICILVKESPKREKMLGDMSSKIVVMDAEVDDDTSLEKLSKTHWTVLASGFQQNNIDSYSNLLLCLTENLTKEVRSGIKLISCKT